MPKRSSPPTNPRKQPVQARSAQLVADILQAAIRVLERDGAQRFTTIRVADEAGVSVGSLYQYFPNKQAILYQLQRDEWERTGSSLEALLGDTTRAPVDRLRATLRAFFHSECDEAPLRLALDDAAPAYRDAPQSAEHRARSAAVVTGFVTAAAPHATRKQRGLAAQLVLATMTSLGKDVSERGLSRAEVDAWADAAADMVGGYLARLGAGTRRNAT
jgi:AcrR family transcriptional regulator|nr:TetR family transcriptional regulator [Kofleriaceae bacterium]